MTTDLRARYGTASPRTPTLPMAFTAGEFMRAMATAWVAFNLLTPIVISIFAGVETIVSGGDPQSLMLILPVFFFSWVIGGPVSLVVIALLGGPLAFALCTALRTVPQLRIHGALLALLGALVGAGVAIAGFLWRAIPQPGTTTVEAVAPEYVDLVDWWVVLAAALVTGASTAFGWSRTMRRALRDDARDAASSAAAHPGERNQGRNDA